MTRMLFWLVACLLALFALRVWLAPAPAPEPDARAPEAVAREAKPPIEDGPPQEDIDAASREALRDLLREANRDDAPEEPAP